VSIKKRPLEIPVWRTETKNSAGELTSRRDTAKEQTGEVDQIDAKQYYKEIKS
jgi:hypothetical protein